MAERSRSEASVRIETGDAWLEGTLALPQGARGIVVFAHGSGSSRHSPRNRYVAEVLQDGGLGTLLFDLLTAEEDALDARTRAMRFDIGLLGRRTVGAVDWLQAQSYADEHHIGCFGASTGAAGALIAAAERPSRVGAVVSRGGRPDLAGEALPRVRAPTLLIVGARDVTVIGMNQEAKAAMRAEVRMETIPDATHLFEEPGALERVAELARDWFVRWLVPAPC